MLHSFCILHHWTCCPWDVPQCLFFFFISCPAAQTLLLCSCTLAIAAILILNLSLTVHLYPCCGFLLREQQCSTQSNVSSQGTWSSEDGRVETGRYRGGKKSLPRPPPWLWYAGPPIDSSLCEYMTSLFIYIYAHIFVRGNYVSEMSRLISWWGGRVRWGGEACEEGEECGGCAFVWRNESLGGCTSVLNNHTGEGPWEDRGTLLFTRLCHIGSSCSDLGGERTRKRRGGEGSRVERVRTVDPFISGYIMFIKKEDYRKQKLKK